MPYNPHRFRRPFNGIDAIGRFLLIVSMLISACLGALYIGVGFSNTPLQKIQTGHLLILTSAGISVFLCFGCGIGLCLRLAFVRLITIGLSAVTCLVLLILMLYLIFTPEIIALEIALISVPLAAILSALIYLSAPGVKEEFTSRSIDNNPSARPYKPFAICMIILGCLLTVIGFELFDYLVASFGEKFFGMPDVFISMTTISLFGLAFITFGGVFTLILGILLFLKSDSARALMAVHGIINAFALFALFAGFSLHKETEKNILIILCLIFAGLGFSYIGWNIFRYMRSRQARALFIKSWLKKASPKKEIILTIGAGFVAIFLVCAIAVSCLRFRQSRFINGMAAVSTGMTKAEVRNLLGKPSGEGERSDIDGFFRSKHPEYWEYYPPLDYDLHLSIFGPSSYAFVVFLMKTGMSPV